MFPNVWNCHPRFMNRTVLVENNDIEGAFNLLNRLMDSEGMLKVIRRTQYYQKPYMQRKQASIEATTAIFNEDLNRKMKFLMRKNRVDAFPGQITT
uniref:30S ribosomal protein S21 n=1 Tax=Panagrellus redivivus TaxID=6233 RepID=A0A7E4W9E7_PANRE